MMKRKFIYLFIALAATILPTHAQKFLNDALTLSNVSLWQQGNSLYVGMTFDMKNLTIGSARSLSLIPLLTDGQHNVTLQEIIVNGKRREKAYIRGLAISKEEPTAIIVPYNKRETFNYTQVIPYQPWMANASLQLVENLCGCGNYQEMNAQELITNDVSTEAKRLSAMSPIVAYIQPTIEVVKNRSEQYEAHLDFPVNKSVILTDFMNNHSELVNIHSMFDKIQNDKNLTVQSISIEGFASPEGPLAFNEQLSKKRAEALKDYLVKKEKVPAKLYKVTFGGENWDGLVKALESSSMKDKETFLNIIKNTTDDAQRKQEIMRVGGNQIINVDVRIVAATNESLEEKVEDIAGIRIICQFYEDIEVVADLIRKRRDMRVLEEKDYITHMKASGYRSYHMIIAYNTETLEGCKEIRAEIQIRTLAMNFWATIEHSLQYKYRGNMPKHLAERLSSAADSILQLDAEMSSVRSEVMDAQNSMLHQSNLVADILNNIENLYHYSNKREVAKIQDEFYRIYETKNLEQLERFHRELDILAEGYRAQALPQELGGELSL